MHNVSSIFELLLFEFVVRISVSLAYVTRSDGFRQTVLS